MRLLICTAALLAGCSSVTKVANLGDGRYMVGAKSTALGRGPTEVKMHAIQQADKHCAQTGKRAVVETTKSSGAPGWTPVNGEIVFRCE